MFLTAAGALAAASVAFLCLPLLNYLGYEYSFAVALILPLISGPYTLRTLRKRWPRGAAVTAPEFQGAVRTAERKGTDFRC